ncbi:hypothetical protein FRUB_07437 [Fimbriiglobus ruber]|uniref:Uncharacterized protein n=1 Tax=Fimbriiglobus ruber TaxID=1908690 RepID=A0A225DQ35_9BACT|nr:hypothetical protein FRUB_07437 [Fimbriiglobus ruber]
MRENSHVLDTVPGVRVFMTNTDIRIFFSIDRETITVLDVAKRHAILATAGITL